MGILLGLAMNYAGKCSHNCLYFQAVKKFLKFSHHSEYHTHQELNYSLYFKKRASEQLKNRVTLTTITIEMKMCCIYMYLQAA